MYKLLLCWRYLRTRWIALASVISVTLGVATMIVVNSVMTGFTREMQGRIHGILSDVVFETHGMNGFHDPERHMQKIREVAGDRVSDLAEIPRMMGALRSSPPATVGSFAVSSIDDFIDGFGEFPPGDILRIHFENGARVIVRPSGTEPKLKAYLDASSTDGDAATRQSNAAAIVAELDAGVRALLGL